jgi:hypothetical protein
MKRDSLAYYVFVRGLVQFGLLAILLYVAVVLLWPGRSFGSHDVDIVIGWPIVGLLWGLAMYFLDKRKRRGQSGSR